MASIEHLFVMLNAPTPTLFNRFGKRGDRQKVGSIYKPHLQQCCSEANVIMEFHMLERWSSYRNGILVLHIALVAKSRASNIHNKLHLFKPLNISWCNPWTCERTCYWMIWIQSVIKSAINRIFRITGHTVHTRHTVHPKIYAPDLRCTDLWWLCTKK